MDGFIVDEEPWCGGRVSDRVICVRANNPSPMTYVGTNTWIVHEPDQQHCVVIDPAPSGEHNRTILSVCKQEGLLVGAIVVTHDHPDHTEGAKELSQLTGAKVYASKAEIAADTADGAYTIAPDRIFTETRLSNRAFCPFEGAPVFDIIDLPGHSSDSVGLLFQKEQAFFTGDVVFRHGPTVVFYPDGNLAEYLASLDTIERLVEEEQVSVLYPAHGYPITDPLRALHATRDHRLERLEQIKQALASGVPFDADALFDAVYEGVDERLRWASLRSIEAQLVYLEKT